MSSIIDLVFNKKTSNSISIGAEKQRKIPTGLDSLKVGKSFDDILGKKKAREMIKQPMTKNADRPEVKSDKKETNQNKEIKTNSPVQKFKIPNRNEIKMLSKLKNYDSMQELFDSIENNREEFSKLFPAKQKEEIKLTQLYKPKNDSEAKMIKRIEEINSSTKDDIVSAALPITKNKRSNSGPRPELKKLNSKFVSENDIYCSRCRSYHSEEYHKKPTLVNENKIFNAKPKSIPPQLPSKKILTNHQPPKTNGIDQIKKSIYKEIKPTFKPVEKQPIPIINKIKKDIIPEIKKKPESPKKEFIKPADKLSQIKQNIQINKTQKSSKPAQNPNALFSREDFDYEDDFVVPDDDNDQSYRYHLNKINRQYKRGKDYYYDDDEDDLNMEATFEDIMKEERRTQMYGDYEDELEEKREMELKKKKKEKMSKYDKMKSSSYY